MDPLVGIREMCLIDAERYKLELGPDSKNAFNNYSQIHPRTAVAPAQANNKQAPRLALYRSNSTQDLPRHQPLQVQRQPTPVQPDQDLATVEVSGCFPMIRRQSRPEFGSQSAIQTTYAQTHAAKPPAKDSISLNLASASPRLRAKFQRFFSISASNTATNTKSGALTAPAPSNSPAAPVRSKFLHYDCQSLLFTLNSASVLLNHRRRTMTLTGASAAHNATRSNSVGALELHSTRPPTTTQTQGQGPQAQPQSQESDFDHGDRVSNHLVSSCPHFRNEIGVECELNVALNARVYSEVGIRPIRASSLSVLQESNSNANQIEVSSNPSCIYKPTASTATLLESVDGGHDYYRTHFYGKDHESWLGFDPVHGPIVANLLREDGSKLWRVVVRTTQLTSLRGSVPDAVAAADRAPPTTTKSKPKIASAKEILEAILPEVQVQCLRQAESTKIQDQLLKIDSHSISSKYKVGVLYCRAGQCTEEEMYGNQYGSPEFEQFLDTLGERVGLRGFQGYAGGLDTKGDSTGYESVYGGTYGGCEIMYHVSTLLPFTASNRQQLLRKRHIGNDVVTIVYQEPGSKPFSPAFIRSQFQHVFIIVQRASALGVATADPRDVQYSVAVTRAKSTPLFGPRLPPHGATLTGKELAGFLAAKCINGERATIQNTDKFLEMATRTRYEYLKDLIVSNCAEATERPRSGSAQLHRAGQGGKGGGGGMFGVFGMNKRKMQSSSESAQAQSHSDSSSASASACDGAMAYAVQCPLPCILAISSSTLAIVSLQLRAAIFAVPTSAVLGWSLQNQNTLRIYYHVGECIEVRVNPASATPERIIDRLQTVTSGVHVESGNVAVGGLYALQANGWLISHADEAPGIKPGSRVVEISGVVAATLTQAPHLAELVVNGNGNGGPVRDTVSIKVVPPTKSGDPRLGCEHVQCPPQLRGAGVNGLPDVHHHHQQQQHRLYQPLNYYAPAPLAPIKYSSSSEGYGTGSSSNSIEGVARATQTHAHNGNGNGHRINGNGNGNGNGNWGSPIRQPSPRLLTPTRMSMPMTMTTGGGPSLPSVSSTSMSMSFMARPNTNVNHVSNVEYPLYTTITSALAAPSPNLNEQRLQRLKSTYGMAGAGGSAGGGVQRGGRNSASPPNLNSMQAVRLRPKTALNGERERANRSSTLQEELIRLINPDSGVGDGDASEEAPTVKAAVTKRGEDSSSGRPRRVRPVSCGEWNTSAGVVTNSNTDTNTSSLVNDTLNNNYNHSHGNRDSGPQPLPLASRVLELEKRLQLERQSKLSLINQLEELRLENERLKAESNSDKSFS